MSATEANSAPAAESGENSTSPLLDGCDDDSSSEFDEIDAVNLSRSHSSNSTSIVGDEDVPKKIDVSVLK
jgi:hypothetical protein